MTIALIAQQQLHDIAPPVDYSLVPTWVVFCASVVVLLLLGLIGWWLFARKRPAQTEPTPRERALAELETARPGIVRLTPYQFSIRVSDILRRYVSDQFQVPLTRQTSVEFLNAVSNAATFSESERLLLADFLSRCDLIKFARYEATQEDSRLLLEEAEQFVKGEEIATV